jgi:hypothetical protein
MPRHIMLCCCAIAQVRLVLPAMLEVPDAGLPCRRYANGVTTLNAVLVLRCLLTAPAAGD